MIYTNGLENRCIECNLSGICFLTGCPFTTTFTSNQSTPVEKYKEMHDPLPIIDIDNNHEPKLTIHKNVVIINGKGGVGKDTLCEYIGKNYKIRNVSSITPIKEIGKQYGWNGGKTEKDRRFLSDLKQAFIKYNDLPTNYLLGQYVEFMMNQDESIMFVHIREPEEIQKFKDRINGNCYTILIHRDAVEKTYGNDSDDLVNDYNYDMDFYNNASIEESGESFMSSLLYLFGKKKPDSIL